MPGCLGLEVRGQRGPPEVYGTPVPCILLHLNDLIAILPMGMPLDTTGGPVRIVYHIFRMKHKLRALHTYILRCLPSALSMCRCSDALLYWHLVGSAREMEK